MSCDGWAALPRGATGLSAVCDCGISWSYSLTIYYRWNFNFLASLCSGGDDFETRFVGNPEDRFSRDEAHIWCDKCSKISKPSGPQTFIDKQHRRRSSLIKVFLVCYSDTHVSQLAFQQWFASGPLSFQRSRQQKYLVFVLSGILATR